MDLWQLPVAPTALYYDPKFTMEASRVCSLKLSFEGDDYENKELVITFMGVEKFLCTYLGSITKKMRISYGKIVSVDNSDLLNDIRAINKENLNLCHYMIMFDDGPCYEFICERFIVKDSGI